MLPQISPLKSCVRFLVLFSIALLAVGCGGSGGSTSTSTSTSTPATDAGLSALTLSAGSITPAFDTATTSYTLQVENTISTTTVTATASNANASITVNGSAVSSGSASSAIALSAGASTITAQVTAEDGTTIQNYTITVNRAPASFELIDPTAAAGNLFGKNLKILANGNIVIPVPNDSSVVSNNGAVHLFNPYTQSVVASFYGDDVDDFFGSNGAGAERITLLSNGNFVIASSSDTVGGISNAGSVTLVDGSTGSVIGTPITGDLLSDQMGSSGVIALNNGNYVIASPNDDLSASNGGSVMLVDGSTGNPIGTAIGGTRAADNLGLAGVLALENGNYVIATSSVDSASNADTGAIILVNGSTGTQIGSTLFGSSANDALGSGSQRALSNGNFVIASQFVDGVQPNTGAVMLFNGATGALINTISGDNNSDRLGSGGVTVLSNGNYVIGVPDDDKNGTILTDMGSVILADGVTGLEISRFEGNADNESFGSNPGVTALSNGHYVIAASLDVVGGNTQAGSVRLMNGTSGAQIGTAIEGDSANDSIGLNGITELSNDNYVIASRADDIPAGAGNDGSVKLINGTTGALISQVTGDANNDNIGGSGVTALANGNYVIASRLDENPSLGADNNAGSIMLMEGVGGTQVGSTLYGDLANDFLSHDATGPIALSNSNIVIISEEDNEPSIMDAGSMILMDGTTGAQIDKVTGATSNDFSVVPTVDNYITESPLGDYFILGLGNYDNSAGVDSGLIRLITQ